jgi:hypothetical protein
MPGSNSNLSTVDGQQVAATAKRKEDDAVAVAQAVAATSHREQEALMAAARKTLDEAPARERATALAWEKEKTITPSPGTAAHRCPRDRDPPGQRR